MSDVPEAVLDASALLALLWDEPGADAVERLLGRVVISAVNWVEVLQRLHAHGVATTHKRQDIAGIGVKIEDFRVVDAEAVASLWMRTRSPGLSLADRACLALATRLDLPAHTADHAWSALDVGVDVVLIR